MACCVMMPMTADGGMVLVQETRSSPEVRVRLVEFLEATARGRMVHLAVDEQGRYWVKDGVIGDAAPTEEGRRRFQSGPRPLLH